MDARFAIWNVLHDGEIAVLSEEGNTITMFVNIPYIRRRIKPLGDSFVLKLIGVQQAESRDFSGSAAVSLHELVETVRPEIIHTDSEAMPVLVETSFSWITLNYSCVEFFLDSGEPVSFEAIEKVSEEYWTEWEAKWKDKSAQRA